MGNLPQSSGSQTFLCPQVTWSIYCGDLDPVGTHCPLAFKISSNEDGRLAAQMARWALEHNFDWSQQSPV